MIIAVNINVAWAEGKTALEASERAWDLSLERASEGRYRYVIGVSNGKVRGRFRKLRAYYDEEFPDRVAFDLSEDCNDNEIDEINRRIEGENLSFFTLRYFE